MGLREQLRARSLPTERVSFPTDLAAFESADRELNEAVAALHEAQQRGAIDLAAQIARRDAAQAAYEAVPFLRFDVTALPPSEWEALVDAHPPTDAQQAGAAWNPVTFNPALLAASVVTEDGERPDAQEWAEIYRGDAGLSAGELHTLLQVAIDLNMRTPAVRVGKG